MTPLDKAGAQILKAAYAGEIDSEIASGLIELDNNSAPIGELIAQVELLQQQFEVDNFGDLHILLPKLIPIIIINLILIAISYDRGSS